MNETRENEGPEDAVPSGPRIDAAWEVLGTASRDKADSYLDEQIAVSRMQTEVLRLQAHELKDELRLRHWSLRTRHISDVMKVTFEISAALVALVIVIIIASAIWLAAHEDGIVIEAFKVPPDMAQQGLTGDVIASQLLDRLTDLQSQTDSVRAPSTYARDFGNDIKVEIPDTGISISEAYRYLAGWLGHRIRISGEVFHTSSGIALTARASGQTGSRFAGKAQNLDRLVGHAAEYVYAKTQPFRFSVYLMRHGRTGEADAVLRQLALKGPQSERPWAYSIWMYVPLSRGDLAGSLVLARHGARLAPGLVLAQINAATDEATAGHDQQELEYAHATSVAAQGSGRSEVTEDAAIVMEQEANAAIAEETGDFGDAVAQYDRILGEPETNGSHWSSDYMKAADAAKMHDIAASRRFANAHTDVELFRLSTLGSGWNLINFDFPQFQQFAAMADWRNARRDVERALATPGARVPGNRVVARTAAWPLLSLADADSGDPAAARRDIGRTPLDCYLCLRARGLIDGAGGNPAGAQYWLARAVAQAPSIPFAYADWGAMLLHRGDYAGAIAKFEQAHEKGPHFADPLEMWGEALIAKNRSDLALSKFEEANRSAPNWGRLHLEWGKALVWTGDQTGAQKQFEIAAHLDLSQEDKSAVSHWLGKGHERGNRAI